jgi:hypothetical protein
MQSDSYYYNSQTKKLTTASVVDRFSTIIESENPSKGGMVLPISDHSQSSSSSVHRKSENMANSESQSHAAEYVVRSHFPSTKSGLLFSREHLDDQNSNEEVGANFYALRQHATSATDNNAYANLSSQDTVQHNFKQHQCHENDANGTSSFVDNEWLAQDVLERAGPAYAYQRKECLHDISSSSDNQAGDLQNADGEFSSSSYATSQVHDAVNTRNETMQSVINQDPNPLRILKPNNQNIIYKQQVNIRYLQPPTPPPAAPIIIREKQVAQPQNQPPIIIRLVWAC